jgi:hypothetical protein
MASLFSRLKFAIVAFAIADGAASSATDGCRSVARAHVVSVRYLGPAAGADDPLDSQLHLQSRFRVRLRMEPAVLGADAPRNVVVNLNSTEAEYISGPGRIVLIYDLRSGDIEPLHWSPVESNEGENICVAEWAAERHGIAEFGWRRENVADLCFNRQ